MELIIVVTTADYDLWKVNWNEETINGVKVKCKEFKDGNKVLLLCQARVREQKIREETTKQVIKVIEYFQGVDIYIAAHKGYVDWGEIRNKVQGKRLKGYKDFSHDEKSDSVYEVLCDLIIHDNAESYQKLKEIIKLPMVNKLSNLKYRIIFLFLPIDIDAQGLIEAQSDEQYWGGENPYASEMDEMLWDEAKRLMSDVEQVVNDSKAKTSNAEVREKICQAWKNLSSLFSNENEGKVKQIFQDLRQVGSVNLEELRYHWTQFHNWLVDLCKAMDKLRDVVEKVEGRR